MESAGYDSLWVTENVHSGPEALEPMVILSQYRRVYGADHDRAGSGASASEKSQLDSHTLWRRSTTSRKGGSYLG